MTGIERYFSEQAELEREAKKKTLAELRAGVTPILQEIEKLSWELEPALHVSWKGVPYRRYSWLPSQMFPD